MRTYEVLPTNENLVQSLRYDTIGRNDDVFRFVNILDSVDCGYSIALDGRWGSGKTFFVRQAKLVLDAENEQLTGMDSDTRNEICALYAKHVQEDKELQSQVCVYYDAWENDNDEDPVLSLIYSILTEVNSNFSFSKDKDIPLIAAAIVDSLTGQKLSQILKELKSETALDSLKSARDLREKICEFFDSILSEKGDRLVIMIDELDRCKPSYAVKMLERIKHYFINERITFVFSVNTYELQKTIRKHYGDGFDAGRYLDRFFDLRIDLPPANWGKYYAEIGFSNSPYLVDQVIDAVIKEFDFEFREVSKFFPKVKAAVYRKTQGNDIYGYFLSFQSGLQFGLCVIVPILIGLEIHDSTKRFDFITGRNSEPLISVVKRVGVQAFSCLLKNGESFDPDAKQFKYVKPEERLEQLYKVLFGNMLGRDTAYVEIGRLEFREEIKEEILRAAGMMTNYSNYKV